jgi:succinate-semialdehyde dehydrogenase/glutarate-semialdehyde dehydrogenase
MNSVNPATGESIRDYPEASPEAVAETLKAAENVSAVWSAKSFGQRGEYLKSAASVLRGQLQEHASLITAEMGKPIAQAEAEIEKCAWACEFFAENAEAYLAPEQVETDAAKSFVVFEPLGTILAVMPWNFPYWQVFRFAAPALMAGNTAVLKHASNVPGCALAIERVFEGAGVPRGVFSTLLLGSEAVQDLIGHPTIRAATLTGSERAGAEIASACGKHLKKVVLELGGSDPFIVLADADIEKTIDGAIVGRTQNNGQSCIASKRFIVEEPVYEPFCERFASAMKALSIGDPADRNTQIGPMAREDLLNALDAQVQSSVKDGAKLLCGGKRLQRQGYYYEPTVLCDVSHGMRVFDEETFGPVAAVTRAKNVDQAIQLANATKYGLGASIWTRNTDNADLIARRIEAGSVFVNGIVKSDPRLPFGGIKASGYGRELSRHGILEFVNTKTIWMR